MNVTSRTLTIALPFAAVAAVLSFGGNAAYAADEPIDDPTTWTLREPSASWIDSAQDLVAPGPGEIDPFDVPDDLVAPGPDDTDPTDGPDDLVAPSPGPDDTDPTDGPDDFVPPTRIDTGIAPLTSTDNTWMLLAAGSLAIVTLAVTVPLATRAARR